MTSRKKPGMAFWATVGLVLVLIYVASFGPICWYVGRPGADDNAFNEFSPALRALYWPLGRIIYRRIPAAAPALIWYARIGLVDGCFITVPGQPDDTDARLIFWDFQPD